MAPLAPMMISVIPSLLMSPALATDMPKESTGDSPVDYKASTRAEKSASAYINITMYSLAAKHNISSSSLCR